jgi:16S rRNA (adenine1518-N6/adenine1519-N6)-dimethyltransferase
MDSTSPKNLFKESEILPKKHLGQNFLVDKGVISQLLAAADIQKNDTVLEIGPGTGNLTLELAKIAQKVISVEKDEEMVAVLKEKIKGAGLKNIEVIQADIRSLSADKMPGQDYKLVANIPYYLTAFLIRSFLEAKNPPKAMTLVIQKEVAQRIASQPPKMNLLAASVQFYAQPKIIRYISKGSFWPVPKVDSAIIKLEVNQSPAKNNSLFFKIIKAGFLQPRKQLINNLSNGLKLDKIIISNWLKEIGISPQQRAQTLKMGDWLKLVESFKIS